MRGTCTGALAAVLTATQFASAVTITFDSNNYSSDPNNPSGGTSLTTAAGTGRSLSGQGKLTTATNASWTANGTHAVVAGAGTNGSAAIVTSSVAAQNVTQSYVPTSTEWGGETFNGSRSLIHFSFDVKLLNHDSTASLTRIWIGYQASTQAAIELYVQGDGDLGAGNLQTVIKANAFDDNNDNVDSNNTFHRLSGTIDHGSNTYTLLLDGQAFDLDANSANGLTLTRAFDRGTDPNAYTGFGGFAVNMRVNGVSNDVYNAVVIDNVVMTLPEPAAAGAFGACGAFALLRRRNRCS
jgi:hypothetical protein